MFNIGNKIIITGSSIKKGKMGPKIRSIGYISKVNNIFMDLNSYFVTNVGVIFYKFGNEKNYRVERKTIPFIFPKQMKTTADFNFSSQQHFLRKISKNNQIKQYIKNIFGTKLLYTLSPIYTNKIEMSIEERIAYLKSLWSIINMEQCIQKENSIPWQYRYKKINIKRILNILSNGLYDNNYKNNFIKDLSKKDIIKYNNFIRIIKLLNLRYTVFKQVQVVYNMYGNYSTQSYMDELYKFLFINLFSKYYKTISKKYLLNQKTNKDLQTVKTIINNLNYAKYKIISIGQKYNQTI